ncbi:alpha/beta fold hydrolase [Rhizobium mesosinicum]|uniref:Alpha/beta hydrolase n=1 Tax=Rhizobium mesosinicum TaxID=335017 RepID=A0ABS7GM80_9HYPH|nr:alpha/beta hydrolase [Rhizobium mesosinicum]MBW9051094.1 alpha/beta hydrolase [Rhizobium mesosinicum]
MSINKYNFPVIRHQTAEIDGLDIFYREAGPVDAPAVLLLHGFPTSSHMFRNLIPALADKYHVVAPDYPGFGLSSMPSREEFPYSFERFAEIVDALVTKLGIKSYTIYVMDYGAPTGFRLALRHPERITGMIVQNGNAYEDGLSSFWDQLKAYWATNSKEARDALRPLMSLDVTKFQYLDGVSDQSRVDPANWVYDQQFLDRPGNIEIQLDLFYDYRKNVALYPQFQAFFRDRQPPTLITWGKNDSIFPAPGAEAFKRDIPNAEFHLIDSGHFALEDRADEIIPLIKDFLGRTLG